MQWWLGVYKNYAGFTGRARRTEFWMFTLFQIIINVVLSILNRVSGAFLIVSILFGIASLIPTLAVGARRLHDTGKSGWLQLLLLIPIVGAIILIVFWAIDGTRGPNQHGPDPKPELDAPAWPSAPTPS